MMDLAEVKEVTQVLNLWKDLSPLQFRVAAKAALLATADTKSKAKFDMFCEALEPEQLRQVMKDISSAHAHANLPIVAKEGLRDVFLGVVDFLKTTPVHANREIFEASRTSNGITTEMEEMAVCISELKGRAIFDGSPFEVQVIAEPAASR